MPLPNDNKSEPAALEHCPDALDDYFLKHLETCESCRSITTDASCEPGAASRRILSQSALVELLNEPAFQEAVTHLQNLSFADAANPAHASPTVEMGSQIGSYRLLEPIACGGMGEVYRAVHVELGKVVAVKLLSPHRAGNRIAVDRFRREMQVQGRFSHPHVVGATDGGEDDGRFYLVMEYIRLPVGTGQPVGTASCRRRRRVDSTSGVGSGGDSSTGPGSPRRQTVEHHAIS